MFIQHNPNPQGKHVGDCTVRAISVALGRSWFRVYFGLCFLGAFMADMLDSNAVWGEYLRRHGFTRVELPNTCPVCYTVRDFASDHKCGIYVLGTGSHAVAVVDGNYVDDGDRGDLVPLYIWRKE